MKLHRYVLIACLLAALAAPTVADQATGRVRVQVLDETGQPFQGVVVTLSNARNLQPPQSLQTNAQGEAIFGVVQAGSGYTVTIEMAGFQKVKEENLSVTPGETLRLPFKLTAQMVEKTGVTGKKELTSIETETNTMQITGEFFQDLPLIGHSYQSALTLAPGVQDTNGDGNPNVHGARERDFKATVDGISNVDPLTGTFMSNINPDAIEEIQVVTSGADASYGRAVGGYAKIITKSGSNDFEGTFKMFYRSSKLDGNGAGSGPVEDFHLYQPSASLSGKIIRDKLFYFLSHEYIDIGLPIALVGAGTAVQKRTGFTHFDKITWQVTPNHKLNFQYSADPYRIDAFNLNALTLPEAYADYTQGGPTYSIIWQTPIKSKGAMTSLVAFSNVGIGFHPQTEGELNDCIVDPLGDFGLRPGGSIDRDFCTDQRDGIRSGSYFEDYQDKRQRLTLKSDAEYFIERFLGKEHTLGFGFVVEDEHFESDSTYTPFSLVSRAQNPSFQLVDPSNPGSAEEAGGTLLRTVFQPGSPDSVHNVADALVAGIYAQDSFRPHPRVLIKAGLRMERDAIHAPGMEPMDLKKEYNLFRKTYETCNPDNDPHIAGTCGELAFASFTAFEALPCPEHPLCNAIAANADVKVRKPQEVKFTNYNLSPKFEVQWDPKGDARSRAFASFGRTYGLIFLGVPAAEQGPFRFQELFEFTERLQNDGSTLSTVDDNPKIISAPTLSVISRNLRNDHTDEIQFGYSKELASETALTFTYIRKRSKDLFQDIDMNHYPEDKGDNDLKCLYLEDQKIYVPQGKPDGIFDDCSGELRLVPGTGGVFNRPRFAEFPDGVPDLKLRSPFFNSVFLIGNFNTSDYTAYVLELRRRIHNNWEMEGSYTWSKVFGQAEDFNQTLGDDPTTVQDEKGYLEYDQRHVIKISSVVLLPVWDLRLGILSRWESGQPYSLISERTSNDRTQVFGAAPFAYQQPRTVYLTHQRNDHRNQSYYDLDLRLERDFHVGKVLIGTNASAVNIFNDDALQIFQVRNGRTVAARRFGRFFELGMKVNF